MIMKKFSKQKHVTEAKIDEYCQSAEELLKKIIDKYGSQEKKKSFKKNKLDY